MNRMYRIIFNRARGLFQVVSEHVRGRGKSNTAVSVGAFVLMLAVVSPGQAQRVIIDNDMREIVDGTDPGGTGPGTKPSPWGINGTLIVGEVGTGELAIQAGGTVTNGYGYIGDEAGSTGTVAVSGEGSTWNNSGPLHVGYRGAGTLVISEGGVVNAPWASIASRRGTSSATVEGDGSHWNINGDLSVGQGALGPAQGTLTISDGGVVEATGTTYLANTSSASGAILLNSNGILATSLIAKGQGSGTLTFDGGILRASSDEADFLRNFEAGDVTIDAGGALFDTNEFNIGIGTDLEGEGGLVKIGEGTLTTTGAMSIGAILVQSGELQVADGTNLLSGTVRVDAATGDQAKMVVDGQDTTVEARALTVGQSGTALFELKGGAQVAMPGSTSANALVLGYSGDADGQATVSGVDSLLRVNGGTTRIGRDAVGSLTIEEGGRFESGYQVVIGDYANGVGHVVVSGLGSAFVTTGTAPTYIGDGGSGKLDIVEGGHVSTSFFASVGRGSDGEGTALVKGEGSSWAIDGNLHIGEYGKGTVVLADGGHIELADAPVGRVVLARYEDGSGTLVVGAEADAAPSDAGTIHGRSIEFSTGAGKLVFNHTEVNYAFGLDLRLDPFSPDPSGNHSIEHLAGHTVYQGNGSQFDGVTSVSGGTLTVNGRLGGTVNVQTGGTLGGVGTVGDTVVADGGIVAPGSSVGTLTVAGGLALSSGSILNYEFGAPGGSAGSPGAGDRIDVTGNLQLEGILNLAQSTDSSDGAVALGYYRLMSYGGALSGSGLAVGAVPYGDASLYEIQAPAGAGKVDLFVSASLGDDTLQHWQGGNGTWNTANAQWFNEDGGALVPWAGNHAAFKHEPGGFNGGFIDVVGMQRFAGLQFVDEGYRLQGTGSLETDPGGSEIRVLAGRTEIATNITGTGGITKTQAGTLVLSGANSYLGGTTISGGVLSVESDANLGHEDGVLAFNGGVLQVTGTDFNDTGRDITWGAGGGGFDIADAANAFYLDRNIVGPGDLIKRGAGALWLAGANAYGNTRVEGGSVFGNTDSLSGNLANAGTVTFNQAANGRFAGDITGWDGTDGAMIKAGAGVLTLEGRSTLDWTVAQGGLTTVAARFSGDVLLDGAATALTFTDASSAAYGGRLSGNGQLTLAGSGALLLTGDSGAFAGTTTVSNGALLVGNSEGSGALGGSLKVLDGATLGGSGTVGSGAGSQIAIASGGTLAPGNSIGTLTVDGDLVFESGSIYAVEVNPVGSDSDRINVTGNATLNGGSVAHVGASGDYDPRSTYTILSAGGTLSGAFDKATSDFAFLTPDLSYDYGAGTVNLELARNERDFASTALTRNQTATALGIESIGLAAGHAVYDAIVQLPDNENLIRASFDALSGEIHASAKSALIEDSRFIRNAANDRIRAAFGHANASVAPALAYGSGQTPTQVDADHAGPVFWSHAFGSWGKTDGDGNAASLDRSTGGLLIGADRPVGDWRVGVLGGYSHTSFDADARRSSGKSDNYHLGLYGGTQWGDVAFRTGAAYSWHKLDTTRSVSIPGINERLSGDYDAGTFQVFGELAYGLRAGHTYIEPFANLAYVSLHTDRFTETGGDAALTGQSDNTDVTFSTLGVRVEHNIVLGDVDGALTGMVGWRHAFGDRTPISTHAFSAGDAFSIAGAPMAGNSAVVEAGLNLQLSPDATFGLAYVGQLAGGSHDHGLKANVAIRF